MKKLFIALLFVFCLSPALAQELSCHQIDYIQKLFLKHHILHDRLSNTLRDRVLKQFIQDLDREKVYFLKSDVINIKRKNKRLFSDLKKGRCHGLYYIYDVFSKRMSERIKFANQYLKKNFAFAREMKYTLDKDLSQHPESTALANQKMKSYIQYQMANVFLIEKDLKKSTQQVSYILNNLKKQMLSWKPQLNHKEKRICKEKSKNSFQVCKSTKWYANYLNAYSQSLDSHSSYMDKEVLEEFYINMNLELEGIGATLSSRFGYTIVERLIPGGAAKKSKKIKRKDKILAVGQEPDKLIDIFGERIEDVVSIIRGPKGSAVFLKSLARGKKKAKTPFLLSNLLGIG